MKIYVEIGELKYITIYDRNPVKKGDTIQVGYSLYTITDTNDREAIAMPI